MIDMILTPVYVQTDVKYDCMGTIVIDMILTQIHVQKAVK